MQYSFGMFTPEGNKRAFLEAIVIYSSGPVEVYWPDGSVSVHNRDSSADEHYMPPV